MPIEKSALYSADLSGATWVKSERSQGSDQSCVEVTDIVVGGAVVGKALRDSMNPHLPHLCFNMTEWAVFTGAIGDGQQNML